MKILQNSFELNPRLVAYTALAGAALAAPAAVEATIVYSGAVNIPIPVTTAGVYLNMLTGATGATAAATTGWDFNPWGTGNLFLYGNGTGNGTLNNATGGSSATLIDNLALGTLISGANTFGNNSVEQTGATAFTLNSTNNYVGIRFLNEATGAVNYGWAQLSIGTAYNAAGRSIIGYGYDDSGAGIAAGAGAIPEPGTIALLGTMAAGAVGVRAWRRRKAA